MQYRKTEWHALTHPEKAHAFGWTQITRVIFFYDRFPEEGISIYYPEVRYFKRCQIIKHGREFLAKER
jgi:hypothetical protein